MHSEVLYKPDLVYDFTPDEIIEIFHLTKSVLEKDPPFVHLEMKKGKVIFIGDTHGDFSTTKYVVTRFIKHPDDYLIFLGDYIDREPEREGSFYNLLYLCLLKINFPERLVLLKGNHEAHYSVFCYPYEFDKELIDIFGLFGRQIHSAATEVFKEMPLMVRTSNGIIASHAGFPLNGQSVDDKSRRDLIIDILWADAEVSPMFRGFGIPKFTESKLTEFLESNNATCLIRGHDPYLAGKIIYSGKGLTIFTSRTYAKNAGIKIARVELSKQIRSARDIQVEDITIYLPSSE